MRVIWQASQCVDLVLEQIRLSGCHGKLLQGRLLISGNWSFVSGEDWFSDEFHLIPFVCNWKGPDASFFLWLLRQIEEQREPRYASFLSRPPHPIISYSASCGCTLAAVAFPFPRVRLCGVSCCGSFPPPQLAWHECKLSLQALFKKKKKGNK